MKTTRIFICTVLILALTLMMCACGKQHTPEPTEAKAPASEEAPAPEAIESAAEEAPAPEANEPAAEEIPAPVESEQPQPCDGEQALCVEFVDDSMIAQLGDKYSCIDATGEYVNNVLFTAQKDIQDLRYLKVSAELSESGEISITEGSVLYTLDKVTEGEAFMITMSLEGYIPDRAISYTDGCGETHYCYAALSGEDNVPLLIECVLS